MPISFLKICFPLRYIASNNFNTNFTNSKYKVTSSYKVNHLFPFFPFPSSSLSLSSSSNLTLKATLASDFALLINHPLPLPTSPSPSLSLLSLPLSETLSFFSPHFKGREREVILLVRIFGLAAVGRESEVN